MPSWQKQGREAILDEKSFESTSFSSNTIFCMLRGHRGITWCIQFYMIVVHFGDPFPFSFINSLEKTNTLTEKERAQCSSPVTPKVRFSQYFQSEGNWHSSKVHLGWQGYENYTMILYSFSPLKPPLQQQQKRLCMQNIVSYNVMSSILLTYAIF